mgnify:CR=1 FL=1
MYKLIHKMILGIVLAVGALLFTTPSVFAKKYDGVTVNSLPMEAPQIKGPMVKRAPDFKKLTGATINVIGVPFSDINPNYYARMGYQISSAPNVCIRPTEVDGWATEPLDLTLDRAQMVEMYEANLRRQTCFLFRPQKYWEFLAAKHAKDQFLWLTQNGQRQGYIHLRKNGDLACLEDFAIADHDPTTLEQLAKSISCFAKEQGISEVHGWFPPLHAAPAWLDFRERKTEITMWKSLSGTLLNSYQSEELSFFRLVDHV